MPGRQGSRICPQYRLYFKDSITLGEGRDNAFIVFLKRARMEIAVEARNSREVREPQRELYQEAKRECECPWKKMIGKPYSGKPNVRFDEGKLEIELSATTLALYSTGNVSLGLHSAGFTIKEDCFLKHA